MVRIPAEYQEVEYIESTGTQYIDTGYIPVLSPILRMRIRVTSLVDKDIAGFVSNVYPSFIIDAAPAQSRWYNRYGDTAAYGVNPRPVVGQIQEWEWGKEVKFNGNLVRTNAECDWNSNTQKMNIFSGRNNGFVAIYSCTLYDGELVRNFIPCYRKSDNEIGMYDTVTGTFFTNQGTGTFLKGNDVNYDTVNLMESRRRILLNTPHLESLSGSALSFETDMASKLKECKIHFTPIQDGSGDPSPDNVRPIRGWDGVTVNVANEYIKPMSWEQGAINGAANTVNVGRTYTWLKTSSNTRIRLVDLISLNETHQYKVTWNTATYELCAQPYDSDGLSVLATSPFNIWQTDYFVFSTPNVAIALRRKDGSSITPSEMEAANVEITEATVTQITIPFPQTIYGGYVDLVKGEVVETYVSRKINTANFGTRLRTNVTDYRGADDYYKSRGLSEFPAPLSNDTYLCDKLYNTGRVTTTGGLTAYMYCNFGSSKYMYVYALASEFSEDTLDGLRAYISDLDPQFVYKVNETDYTTYPLDHVTIRTLRGLNNIWSDANGNIELKFWTH